MVPNWPIFKALSALKGGMVGGSGTVFQVHTAAAPTFAIHNGADGLYLTTAMRERVPCGPACANPLLGHPEQVLQWAGHQRGSAGPGAEGFLCRLRHTDPQHNCDTRRQHTPQHASR